MLGGGSANRQLRLHGSRAGGGSYRVIQVVVGGGVWREVSCFLADPPSGRGDEGHRGGVRERLVGGHIHSNRQVMLVMTA